MRLKCKKRVDLQALNQYFSLAPELEGTPISEIRLMTKPDSQGNYPKL